MGLLRSGLLKRLESSVHSFAETARRMVEGHDAFLSALDLGRLPTARAIEEWPEVDSDKSYLELLKDEGAEPASDYDVDRLRTDVQRDRDLLASFMAEAQRVVRENDPKLLELREKLAEIAAMAHRDGTTEEERRDKRKIIIFTYYENTVEWIEEWLDSILQTDDRLACYRDRLASVSGNDSRRGISREAAIFGFAPKSTEAPGGWDDDRFDIIITTDVLAEGQNLQQCRNIINYDLPWNPMRLVQRHGRIDRIGSPHNTVFIWCFFPDEHLDELLGLEERIRHKLRQAALSIGVESEVIPDGATSDIVYAGTRAEIEALRREDPVLFENAGEDPNAHSGEEYRQELRGWIQGGQIPDGINEREEQFKRLPWAAGSGFRSGGERGWFFCAKVGDRLFLRFVPMDMSTPIRDTLDCLRRITCTEDTPRFIAPELLEEIYRAWEVARDDIYDEWDAATDPRNIQPRVRPLFRRIAEHLRRHPPPDVENLDNIVDGIEAPWGARIERQLRQVFDPDVDDTIAVSRRVVEKVRELGLQPYRAPLALPPIDKSDIALVCWMVVDETSEQQQ